MIRFRSSYSRGILLQMGIAAAAVLFAAAANVRFLSDFYLGKQITATGIVINGGIMTLFLLGLSVIVYNLLRYLREEAALGRFIRNIEDNEPDLTERVSPRSMIARRYQAVREIHRQHAPVNHGALASMLTAEESTRISIPKFINNILILTGVFGTIVSLSIALLGASDLLESADDIGGMGLVIHGMSTALSTTITAIVCYVFFGYFYLKLIDAQTRLITGIEQVTSVHLLPRHTAKPDSMVAEVVELVRALHRAADQLARAQSDYSDTSIRLREVIDLHNLQMVSMSEDVKKANRLLSEGFRLNHGGD